MSMNEIIKALGDVDEAFINEAEQILPRNINRKFLLPFVASLVIVAGVVFCQIHFNGFMQTVPSDNSIEDCDMLESYDITENYGKLKTEVAEVISENKIVMRFLSSNEVFEEYDEIIVNFVEDHYFSTGDRVRFKFEDFYELGGEYFEIGN
ncbi:MAG: hypothetical protein R3Y35_08050 [Clostridia bacterium]